MPARSWPTWSMAREGCGCGMKTKVCGSFVMQAVAPLSPEFRFVFITTLAWLMLEASASAAPPEEPLDPVVEAPEQTPLISSGTPAQNCQWPTVVVLDDGKAMCSGTLVHPQIV